MYAKLEKIPKTILTLLYGVVLVWVLLLGYEWGKTYFENQQKSAYKEVPFELKLKAKPEDVIYSQAYKTASGTDEVKYAYLTEEAQSIPNEDVSKRTPVSQTEVLEKYKDENGKPMEKLHTTFVSKPQFYKNSGTWRQVEYATTTSKVFSMSGAIPYIERRELAERLLPGKPVFGATATFYPDPNIEVTSVDGQVQSTISGQATIVVCWSAARSGTGLSSDDVGTTADSRTTVAFPGGASYTCTMVRTFLLFDTSTLTSAATISSATLGVYVTTQSGGIIHLITTAPASNTAIATGDWSNVTMTDQATSLSSITAGAYNTFTLNSTGLGNISKTSITKFGMAEDRDYTNTTPSVTGTQSTVIASADTAGTSQDPKLDVTYALPGGFSVGNWFPF